MRKLRLCVCKKLHKFLDSDGEWDGVYDESYEYIIYDEEGIEVAGWDGYRSEEAARLAGVLYLRQDMVAIVEALADNLFDNIIGCIEWLIKEGYFNKEYLV